ncbi:amidohydrolase family protein [Allomuricauda sp. SCSIO 65647]|uniref:amidohydrolase family protein n=1 Tax=Allomuricauda sp. SCSIO 65647 TaxID=2908843 RepID=UPI001F31611A|nr:amidohydrolase family protein [Muricauda sp. SCSIO 65647]UJH67740.1 amidohydrolase family protein [Muricauda sp. SCSIO 65647]
MKNTIYLIIALLLTACNQAQEKISKTAILISDVNVIDVKTGQLYQNRQVVIDSGKIKSIAEIVESPDAYPQKIDGSGKFLMPGLAEMHAHIPSPPTSKERIEDVLFLYLSNGITTIRGMLGHPLHLNLREKAENGEILSPRIFTSSPSLNGNSVTSRQEAIDKVSAYQKDGYDFLKIHPGIQLEVFDQLVETANDVGIEFAGHVPVDVGIRHALKSRYVSIDHVDGFLEGLVPESANVNPSENGFFGYNFTPLADTGKIDGLVQMAKENKVWIVPTQSLFTKWFAPTDVDSLLSLPEMKYMPKETLANWRRVKEQFMADPAFDKDQWKRFDAIRRQLIKKLSDNGHGMLLGSDAPQLFNVPGFSIHHEMQDMADAGMTNLEIIQSGTINPAIYFKMEDTFGQVKEGLEADLVLLEENPLENLNALKKVSGVIRQGKWHAKEEIDKRLTKIAEQENN